MRTATVHRQRIIFNSGPTLSPSLPLSVSLLPHAHTHKHDMLTLVLVFKAFMVILQQSEIEKLSSKASYEKI